MNFASLFNTILWHSRIKPTVVGQELKTWQRVSLEEWQHRQLILCMLRPILLVTACTGSKLHLALTAKRYFAKDIYAPEHSQLLLQGDLDSRWKEAWLGAAKSKLMQVLRRKVRLQDKFKNVLHPWSEEKIQTLSSSWQTIPKEKRRVPQISKVYAGQTTGSWHQHYSPTVRLRVQKIKEIGRRGRFQPIAPGHHHLTKLVPCHSSYKWVKSVQTSVGLRVWQGSGCQQERTLRGPFDDIAHKITLRGSERPRFKEAQMIESRSVTHLITGHAALR